MYDQKERQTEENRGSVEHKREQEQEGQQQHKHEKEKGQEQSSHEVHPLHPAATPTRAQQQRHRRNLRLSGIVDVEPGGLPRFNHKEERRDSWIDRINNSAKQAIRRTSVIAGVDDTRLIDKVADSINQYGEQHEHDSWTDKVLSYLFPSMELDPNAKASLSPSDEAHQEMRQMKSSAFSPSLLKKQETPEVRPSDESYDQVQQVQQVKDEGNLRSWVAETAQKTQTTAEDAVNTHPYIGMVPETSDSAYDDAQAAYPDDQSLLYYADALEEQEQKHDPSAHIPWSGRASWSGHTDQDNQYMQREQEEWPPLGSVIRPAQAATSIEASKKDRRRQRLQKRKSLPSGTFVA